MPATKYERLMESHDRLITIAITTSNEWLKKVCIEKAEEAKAKALSLKVGE